MSRVKDLYIAELEEKYNKLLDQGMDEDKAYETAGDQAYKGLGDKMADLADREKLRRKEGR